MKAWKAELFLLLMTLIWGGTFLFTKIGLQFTSPALYVIIRYTIALTICLIIFGKNLKLLNRQTFISGIVLGIILGGGFLLQTMGLKYTTVSKSAFITGVSVVLTPIVFWFIEKRKISYWQIGGVVIVTIGLWIFTQPEFDNINLGDFLTLLSTFFWAFYITYMDVFTKGKSDFKETSLIVIFQFVAALPLAIIFFLVFETNQIKLDISDGLIYSLVYNAIIASFFLTIIHTSVQRYTSPVKAALIFSLEPVIASYLAYLFMSESMNTIEFIGAAVLMFGILISETGEYFISKILPIKSKEN
ncbi:MAG: DMT family transporter [Ignavibacteriae bacterium]|nr:DMT family transporter [Ignavibacteriota bacterium]